MSVMVAVTDSPEGAHALHAAVQEAQRLGTDLVVLNLTLHELDLAAVPGDLGHEVVERRGRRDPAETVLDALEERRADVDRLVVGVRRRSPVGKAVLGSLSQRVLLEADVPVLAVKLPAPPPAD